MTILSKALKRTLLGAAMASAAILAPAQAAELDLSGKTVNFVIPFAETGGSAAWANFYAPLLSEELPGKPNVVVKFMPRCRFDQRCQLVPNAKRRWSDDFWLIWFNPVAVPAG